MARTPRVIVAGAGPVGLYTAHALERANIDYVVIEQQPEIVRLKGAGIFLMPHTVRLLDQIGLYERAANLTVPVTDKAVLLQNGRQIYRYSLWKPLEENHKYRILAFSRSDLLRILYESLPNRESRIKTNARIVDIESNTNGVRVHLADGTVEEGSLIIGADGIHSRTREIMESLVHESSDIIKKKKASPMLSSFKGLFGRVPYQGGLEEGVIFETHGTGVISQASSNNEFIYFGVITALDEPTTARHRFSDREMEEEAKRLSDIYAFPNVKFGELWKNCDRSNAILVHLEEGIIDKWYHERIVLVGDSVHKMTPIAGLGANTGLQCAAALMNQLHGILSSGSDFTTKELEKAFQGYQSTQEPICRHVVDFGAEVTRLFSWNSWAAWLMDRFILPWMDLGQKIVKDVGPMVRDGHVLEYVPFEGKTGLVPWNRVLKKGQA